MEEDRLIFYDDTLVVKQEIPDYMDYLQKHSAIHPDDPLEDAGFLPGKDTGRGGSPHPAWAEKQCACCFGRFLWREWDAAILLSVIVKDVTKEKKREALLEERAMKDSLTSLYNHFFGKELINEYLKEKDPYATCGMMVLDVDYFKQANDRYGHLSEIRFWWSWQVCSSVCLMRRTLSCAPGEMSLSFF